MKKGDIIITIFSNDIWIKRVHSSGKAFYKGHEFIPIDGSIYLECHNKEWIACGSHLEEEGLLYDWVQDIFNKDEVYVVLDSEKVPGVWEKLKYYLLEINESDSKIIEILDKILEGVWNSKEGLLLDIDRIIYPIDEDE